MQCRLEAGDGTRSAVTVTVTGVEDDQIQFDIEAVEPAEQTEEATDSVGQGVVGDRVTITLGGVDAGEVILESVTSRTTPTDAEFGEPPANGTYWTVTVVVNALPGQTFDINPLDFYLRDEAPATAGTRSTATPSSSPPTTTYRPPTSLPARRCAAR